MRRQLAARMVSLKQVNQACEQTQRYAAKSRKNAWQARDRAVKATARAIREGHEPRALLGRRTVRKSTNNQSIWRTVSYYRGRAASTRLQASKQQHNLGRLPPQSQTHFHGTAARTLDQGEKSKHHLSIISEENDKETEPARSQYKGENNDKRDPQT